jgi:hypothetical protein
VFYNIIIFNLRFDTTEFYNEKIYVGCGGKSLDDARATRCPTMSPSEAVNAYDSASTNSTIESEPLTVNCPQDHRKREKNYSYTN